MSKFEKRLCVFAIVFFVIYFGALIITIQSRISNEKKITRIESVAPGPDEAQVMLAELLLPMLIFFTLTVCFIIIKKKRSKAVMALDESDEEYQ
jgi:hypothetical protein